MRKFTAERRERFPKALVVGGHHKAPGARQEGRGAGEDVAVVEALALGDDLDGRRSLALPGPRGELNPAPLRRGLPEIGEADDGSAPLTRLTCTGAMHGPSSGGALGGVRAGRCDGRNRKTDGTCAGQLETRGAETPAPTARV